MKFNLRQLVTAVAVATASLGAVAAPVKNLGTNPGYTPIVGFAADSGALTYSFSFILDSVTNFSTLAGELTSLDPLQLTATLTGPTNATATFAVLPTLDGSFSFGSLADGAYLLSFTGFPVSATLTPYGGFVTSAAAVPEPTSVAMLLAGLGVAGVLVRRRKS